MPKKEAAAAATHSLSPLPKDGSHASTGSRTDSIIEAFKDPSVVESIACALGPFIARAIDEALTRKLNVLQATVDELSCETATLKAAVDEVKAENQMLTMQLEQLERYTRRDNLIISGLPEGSYAESATRATNTSTTEPPAESSAATEKTVLKFFTETMGLALVPSDIVVAHRLKKGKKDPTRPIIVRLVNKRVRDNILRAKKSLDQPQIPTSTSLNI